jgi:hypothetical protein
MGKRSVLPDRVKEGMRFGRLEMLGPAFRVRKGNGLTEYLIVAQCECGVVLPVRAQSVLQGLVLSCGCLRSDKSRDAMRKMSTTHGMSRDPIYTIWNAMIQRCENQKHEKYGSYGGRGIMVCDEWRADCCAFIEWAKTSGYGRGLEIDRRDTNGNYEPGNCRWITRKQNMNNIRSNAVFELNGEQKTAAELADDPRAVVGYFTLLSRLKKGWGVLDAMTTPARQKVAG